METRPRIKIELTKQDKILETVSLTLLLVLWIGSIAFFSKLPDTIPTHFNAAGKADGFSHKASLFILPIIATIIYTGITVLNKYPHIYNYTVFVTEENAKRLYTSATRLIRVIKLAVVIIFSGIVFMTVKTAFTNGNGLGTWFLPAAIALMILPNIFYLMKSSNSKQAAK